MVSKMIEWGSYMLVSTKGRYALRVLIDLAEQPCEQYVPLKEIAERQDISEKYLESILRVLVKGKILVGVRGKGGGYMLTRRPEEYRVGEILRLTEETLAPVACLEDGFDKCQRKNTCKTLHMWSGLGKVIEEYLDGITVADLLVRECDILSVDVIPEE